MTVTGGRAAARVLPGRDHGQETSGQLSTPSARPWPTDLQALDVEQWQAASLCGQSIAHWTVRAVLNGTQVSEAQGIAVDADTWGPHGAGAGVTALPIDVP